ncbi:MAG TPA: GNAT family protein [Acidobacteriaceae bacterium]|nr:GNAT family protein [Acidobacteriaceae bacterium]
MAIRIEPFTLQGRHVRLEPLELRHIDALAAASAEDPDFYRWSAVPIGRHAVRLYVESALDAQLAGTALPLATVRLADDRIIGSTRYFNLEWWSWPEGHRRRGRTLPDVCEIGYTWLAQSAIRTAINTEAKLLMLNQAFDSWGVVSVCLHTDERNARSRAAMERMGARFEGILRSHRLATDGIPRNSARYSITAAEWPEVKRSLAAKLRD